jgi:hypothetical protein
MWCVDGFDFQVLDRIPYHRYLQDPRELLKAMDGIPLHVLLEVTTVKVICEACIECA